MIFNYIITVWMVLIKASFQTKHQIKLNSNVNFYKYLPPGHGSFHFSLTQSISFDRKRFRDIWIYKNGLITLGEPLEESGYPIMVERGVQPFENIVGSNIVAVFIMKNKLLPGSLVRVREIPLKLIENKTEKLIKLIESRIHEVYGNLVISEIENVIDIEWIKMKPEGIGNNKTNTFKLLLLSTKTQTFCVFYFMKIDSIVYKLNGKSFIYQSGLSSYSDMKYILPTYNVTRNDNQLYWTSNIGLENIWLLTIGDTSYNIDFGWPSRRTIYSSSGENSTDFDSKSQSVIPRKSSIPLMKREIVNIKKVFKSKRTAENMMNDLVKSTNSPDSLISTNHQLNDWIETKNYHQTLTTESDENQSKKNNKISTKEKEEKYSSKFFEKITTDKYSIESLSTLFHTQQQQINLFIRKDNDFKRDLTTIKLNPETIDSETADSETTDSKTTVSMTTDSKTTDSETTDSETTDSETTDSETTDSKTTVSMTTDPKTTDSETTDSKTTVSMTTDPKTTDSKTTPSETTASETTDSKTTVSMTTDRKTTDSKTTDLGTTIKLTVNQIKTTPYLFMDEISQVKSKPESNNGCSHKLCKENEECLIKNENHCCKCKPGSSLRYKSCIKNEDSFNIKSGGNVKFSIMGKQWNLDLVLQIVKEATANDNFPRAHIMLMTNEDISLETRNFLLLLYPLFHIPLTFYASSWNYQDVANLNSLVDKIAGIQINLGIGSYEKIYITFKLDKQDNEDHWNISLDGIDLTKLTHLNLHNSRFDEKSSEPYNLVYILQNSNSIEFPLQTMHFQDEFNLNSINITWRGTMQFAATCLSNYINNKKYYIKFSDKSYCNSDCYSESDNKKVCRILCLSSPHVFDEIPEQCQGNFCGVNQRCVNYENRYECKCKDEMSVVNDICISDKKLVTTMASLEPLLSPSPPTTTILSESILGCSLCSNNANCFSIKDMECCTCKTGYIGSGIKCLDKSSEFELRMSGIISVLQGINQINSDKTISLLFRQYFAQNDLNYASFFEIGNFPYSTIREQQLLDFILLLSPLFDIPLALFASQNNQTQMDNIYALSKGYAKINIQLESNIFDSINIFLEFNEMPENMQISINISGIPTNLNPNWLLDSHEHFTNRGISPFKYRIKGNQIIFDKHEIRLPERIKPYKMSWKGIGELHKCVNFVFQRNFEIISNNQFDCNPRCFNKTCKPYCQAISTVQEQLKKNYCSPLCKINEKCIDEHCVCIDGYLKTNKNCQPINKTLECQHSSDCRIKQYMECKRNHCVCISGYELLDSKCVMIEKCRDCGLNEECINRDCICQKDFVRNRISQQCIFDCSLCDPYSTFCSNNTCICHDRFKSSKDTNKICQLMCNSDSDCPTNERCDAKNVCICPFTKYNGICKHLDGCSLCHRNAICKENVCKCYSDWIGDGNQCIYNCSLCFDRKYCSINSGCSCPPEYEGNGKICKRKGCREECPRNSVCIEIKDEYKCVCEDKFIKEGNECLNDLVQVNIVPSDDKIEIREGNDFELFCLGYSKIIQFHLFWIRQSNKKIKGQQEYIDKLNRTLKLSLIDMQVNDSDQYICGSKGGENKSVTIKVIKDPVQCKSQCSPFATCENKQCICQKDYFGDGMNCYPKQKCNESCKPPEICDETMGKCGCKSGYINYKTKCIKDCRKHRHCDVNAKCNSTNGLCECFVNFIGNGTNCWKQSANCLLTRRCASNATCTMIPDILQYICLCNKGFVGDGSLVCYPQIDCSVHRCGPKAFCEPFIVENQFGNHVMNGKCSCEPGFVFINNKCSETIKTSATIWVSMGESIISHKLSEDVSKIHYIEIAKNTDNPGIITSMTGDCSRKRLIWAGKNGKSIQSSYIVNFSNVTMHLSNLGKILGISIDEITGNIYFSDSYNGRIGVIDIDKNVSRILIEKPNYSPGPLIVHSKSGKLFWIVNDYQVPRIEMAELTGENNSIFLKLNKNAVSLTITSEMDSNDRLCWMEVNKDIEIVQRSGNRPVLSILKCTNITNNSQKHSSKIVKIHKLSQEEPFSALGYFEKKFYWSVRNGTFLKYFGPTESRLNIHPNCCDARIRGLKILTEECSRQYSLNNNPCLQLTADMKCSDLCVPKLTEKDLFEPVCLSRNI